MTSNPYNRFFGNLTSADYKLQRILKLNKSFETLIKKNDLELARKEDYDENPELYGKKFFFRKALV